MSFDSVTVVRPYEQIVKQIQRAIRDGRYERGARLPTERELAESFGVSRSVVREAIKVLDAMGLVESRQGSGLYVRNNAIQTVSRAFILSVAPNAESVEKLFEFRQGLEMESARLAAARRSDAHLATLTESLASVEASLDPIDWDAFGQADSHFHQTIAAASGNPYLEVAIATARDMLQDVVHLLADSPGSMREALAHHRRILDAITDHDAARAVERMAAHVGYTAEVVQHQIAPPAS